jgi:hypothetical protein
MMPVVTLIPAYKHRHFDRALNSVLQQHVKPSRILISDDSLDGIFSELFSAKIHDIESRFGTEIKIITGPKKGGYANILHLLNFIREEEKLIHLLFDDDIIFPGFYESHIYFHENFENSLITLSKRTYIGDTDTQIKGHGCPVFLSKTTNRLIFLDAADLYKMVVPNTYNWLGEFSNAIFKREAILELIKFRFSTASYLGLGDIGAFLQASEKKGALLLINDYLGSFRIAPSSNTANTNSSEFQAAILAWVAIALHAVNSQFISEVEFFQCCERVKSLLEGKCNAQTSEFIGIVESLTRNEIGSRDLFLSRWALFLENNLNNTKF